jgi:haloalkane dehalogenase
MRLLSPSAQRFGVAMLNGLLLVGAVRMFHAHEPPVRQEPRLMAISADFPYKAQFVEVLGSRMHYIDEGGGEPILLLHGNPTSSYLWRNVIPYLKPRGRVIAVDNIGMGKSDELDIAYTFQDHSRYIDAFIDTLGLTNLTLVGHDWGSVLGLSYAARHEANVKGVVFMEALIPPAYPRRSF